MPEQPVDLGVRARGGGGLWSGRRLRGRQRKLHRGRETAVGSESRAHAQHTRRHARAPKARRGTVADSLRLRLRGARNNARRNNAIKNRQKNHMRWGRIRVTIEEMRLGRLPAGTCERACVRASGTASRTTNASSTRVCRTCMQYIDGKLSTSVFTGALGPRRGRGGCGGPSDRRVGTAYRWKELRSLYMLSDPSPSVP